MINYIDIAILAVFLVSAYLGYKKGILLSIVNIFRYAIGFSLCFFCSENLAYPLYERFMKDRALEYIQTKIITDNGIGDAIKNIGQTLDKIPDFLLNTVHIDSLTVPKGDDASLYLLNNFAEPLLITVAKIIIFILVFIAFFLSTGLIIRMVQKSSKRRDIKRKENNERIPLTKRVNRVLGAMLGILKSAVLVLAIASLLSFLQQFFDEKTTFYTMLETSKVLGVLDSINPFNFLTEGMI